MQSTAVLNFAKTKKKNIKKEKHVSSFWCDSHLLVLLAQCHLPSSDSAITRRHGKHLDFSQSFNSTVVGEHVQ